MVLAFRPNPDEPFYFVSEDVSELKRLLSEPFGKIVNGPQCGVCGSTEYTVESNSLMPRYGACRCNRCMQRYRIVSVPDDDVVFPA